MNNSVIKIDGIHATERIYPYSEHSTDWYAVLTISDEHGNAIDIIINNGILVETKWKE